MMLRALSVLPRGLRCAVLRRALRFEDAHVRGLRAEIVTCPEDALAAARILHDAYVGRRIMDPHASGLRVTPAQILPSTFSIVAKRDDEVIGTISLQVDGALGLPLDAAWGEDIAPLRRANRRVAEVGALAVKREHRHSGVLHLLNRAMFDVAEAVGVNDLVMSVTAWAADLYASILSFSRVGGIKAYPGLSRPLPSVALHLPLEGARERLRMTAPASYAVYVERTWTEISLPSRDALSVDTHDASRLAAARALVASRRDVFRALDRHGVLALRRAVPGIYWPTPSQLDIRELEYVPGLDGVPT